MRCPINGKPCSKHRIYSAISGEGAEAKHHLVCEDCMHTSPEIRPSDELGPCARCGTTIDQVVRNSRVGCASCYDHFEEPLSYIIPAVQIGGKNRHVGTIPECYKRSVADSIDPVAFAIELENEMKAAIREERYEAASKIEKTLSKMNGVMKKGELGPDERAELAEIVYRHLYPGSPD